MTKSFRSEPVRRVGSSMVHRGVANSASVRSARRWEDFAPSFDDKGQHVEAAVDCAYDSSVR
jgi:hypothetical protein